MAPSTGDGDHVPDCDEPLCAGCTLADGYYEGVIDPDELDTFDGEMVRIGGNGYVVDGTIGDGPELASWLMFEDMAITGTTAYETHQPWFCSECACFRCSAWTPEGGGRCCWFGVCMAMP